VGLWAVWAAILLATLVPRPIGLTALRTAAPAALVAAIAAAFGGHVSPLALGWTAVTAAVALAPETSIPFVNGAAYPNERRYPLRVPGPLLLGLLPLSWALVVAGVVAGPLLLAARQWVVGGVALVAGGAAAFFLSRSLHLLSRRWVVFVPAGLVLHDPMSLTDPVLFLKNTVEALRPAPADTDSLDLTQRAPGLALELLLKEKVAMVLAKPRDPMGEAGRSARLLFTPTRPGRVLAEARARRLPVE
jgi:hypothetical protein